MPDASTFNSAALLLLGGTVAGYWYRVMRMAAKARRRTGRAANLLPPEPLGRFLRAVWAPAVIIWIVHPLMSAFWKAAPAPLKPLWQPADIVRAGIAWLGTAIAAACFFATLSCWKRMGTAWRMGIDPDEKNPLIASGPFACVRHPIYSLSGLMMLASFAAIPSPLMLATASVHLGLLGWESSREERHLLRVHGPAYAEYRGRVRRFLPIISSRNTQD